MTCDLFTHMRSLAVVVVIVTFDRHEFFFALFSQHGAWCLFYFFDWITILYLDVLSDIPPAQSYTCISLRKIIAFKCLLLFSGSGRARENFHFSPNQLCDSVHDHSLYLIFKNKGYLIFLLNRARTSFLREPHHSIKRAKTQWCHKSKNL